MVHDEKIIMLVSSLFIDILIILIIDILMTFNEISKQFDDVV